MRIFSTLHLKTEDCQLQGLPKPQGGNTGATPSSGGGGEAASVDGADSHTWTTRQTQELLLLQQAVILQQTFCPSQLVLCQPLPNTKLPFLLFKKARGQEQC